MRRRLRSRRSRLRPQELGSIGSHQNGCTHGAGVQALRPSLRTHPGTEPGFVRADKRGVERGQTARTTARGMPLPFAGVCQAIYTSWGALEFHNPLGLKLLPLGPSFGENVLSSTRVALRGQEEPLKESQADGRSKASTCRGPGGHSWNRCRAEGQSPPDPGTGSTQLSSEEDTRMTLNPTPCWPSRQDQLLPQTHMGAKEETKPDGRAAGPEPSAVWSPSWDRQHGAQSRGFS